jgi:hypothetical protein
MNRSIKISLIIGLTVCVALLSSLSNKVSADIPAIPTVDVECDLVTDNTTQVCATGGWFQTYGGMYTVGGEYVMTMQDLSYFGASPSSALSPISPTPSSTDNASGPNSNSMNTTPLNGQTTKTDGTFSGPPYFNGMAGGTKKVSPYNQLTLGEDSMYTCRWAHGQGTLHVVYIDPMSGSSDTAEFRYKCY